METSERKHFLFLMALSQRDGAIAKAVLSRIHKSVDATAAPLWIDSRGMGVFITTELHANRLWSECFRDALDLDQAQAVREVLFVEVGPDFAGPSGTKAVAWLNAKFPRH